MTHQEILNKTKAEIDSLCAQAKEKLDAMAPKELEVGKWYISVSNNILYYGGVDNIYGLFRSADKWVTDIMEMFERGLKDFHGAYNKSLWQEATSQEVESALIEEAKRIGHTYSEYDYNPEENELCGINDGRLESVFCDGHWEQPTDKFAELKEAHRNGAKIQVKCELSGGWGDLPDNYEISWKADEYRIKPEEKPKVGDVVKAWVDDEKEYFIGVLDYINVNGDYVVKFQNSHDTSIYTFKARFAKTLTQQETIELLFNNK